MTEYVLGFAFHEDKVLLIFKRKGPAPVIGHLNGIGGKIEGNETPEEAMAREFKEECGLATLPEDWVMKIRMEVVAYDAYIFIMSTRFQVHRVPQQMTDERVSWQGVHSLEQINVVPNLRWMIPFLYADEKHTAVVRDFTPGK